MSKVQINEIIDGIYFQKLSIILTNLQQWQKNKNNTINDVYGQTIFRLFLRFQKNGKNINNQLTQLLKILNLQYHFLIKLKKQDRNDHNFSYAEFRQFHDNFMIVKESLLQLNEQLGKFIGVTGYQFTQLKRLYQQVDQIKEKYQYNKSKLNLLFNQKKQLIYSKKNIKKTFQIGKLLDIIADLDKQKNLYNDLSRKLSDILERQISMKEKMYKDICDNLNYISSLYEKSFQKDILGNIRSYFKKKLQQGIAIQRQHQNNCKQNEGNIQQAFRFINQKFYQYFNQFLDEITITNWGILYSSKKKQQEEKQINTNLILTFDNKILITTLTSKQKRNILLEINLEDIKIYKPNSLGQYQVKNKKTKQKIFIKFPKIQNQDQFFLHFQQIAQKA